MITGEREVYQYRSGQEINEISQEQVKDVATNITCGLTDQLRETMIDTERCKERFLRVMVISNKIQPINVREIEISDKDDREGKVTERFKSGTQREDPGPSIR